MMRLRPASLLALLLLLFLPAVAAGQLTISGRVRDSLSGTGLPGVRLTTGRRLATTDATGQFTLTVATSADTVEFHRAGYATRRLPAGDVGVEVWLSRAPELMTELTVSAAPPPVHVGGETALGLGTADRIILGGRGDRSLADALATVEGVSAQHPGAWGAKAFVRGLGGERVTVLIDGDRVNRACNNGMDAGLATIDAAMVERVEVIAGPGSVLYGSGNIGGVINVVTRRPSSRPYSGEVRLGASSAVPGATLGGTFGVVRPRFDLTVAADWSAYDDYRTPTGTLTGSSYRHGTGSLRLGLKPAQGHRVDLKVERYLGRDIGYPAMAGAQIPQEDRLLTAVDYGWQISHGVLDGLSAKVYRQALDHDMEVAMSMTMPNGMKMTSVTEAITTSATYGGRVQTRLRPAPGARLDAGVELSEWRADGTRWVTSGAGSPMASTLTLRSWPDVVIRDVGAFSQGEWLLGTVIAVSAGGRVDQVRNQADGQHAEGQWVASGNVGLKIYPAPGWVARATVGRGYRIADPTELHGLLVRPDGFIYEGNPELATETGRNLEAAVSYAGATADVGVTVFRNDLHNLISSVLLPDSTISGYRVRQFANLAKARVQGITARTSIRFHRSATLRGTASYTHGENLDTRTALPLIPPLEGQLALRVTPGARLRWLELETRWAGRQDRAATAQGEAVTNGFAVANLRAGFSALGAEFVPGIDNIFDKAYRNHLDPARIILPGRNFFLRVTRAF